MKENRGKTGKFSERHMQAVEALKRSEERYALAQRAANIGSWDWDIATNELVWSEQIESMFGFGRGEFGATYEAFLRCVHPEDRQGVVDLINACIEQGKDYAIEHRIVWPDETVRWVSETGDVIRDENGKAIRMVGIVQDITERKNVEARQRLAGRILESLSREVAGLEAIRDVVSLVKEFSGFEAVGIRLHEGDDFPYFETKGFSEGFVQAENYLCVRDKNGKQIYDSQGDRVLECMCGNVLSGRTDPTLPFFTEGGSFWTNSTTKLLASARAEDLQTPVRGHCNKAGYESVALIPLRSGDQIVGLLQLNDTRPGRFTTEMIRFLEEIGASIGIALARIGAEEDVKNLAKFPSENPNPVLRVTKDGVLLYANAASGSLLTEWGCKVGQIVPDKWCQTVSEVFVSESGKRIEIEHGDRTFSFMVAPVTEANYVNLYGRDITERKQAEEDLRKYQQHLEELVQARTEELTEANKQLLQEIEERKRLEKALLDVSEREQRRIGRELH
ncbi:MAG: PAS domain-containing protein, partial [Planctomycetota bacterium]